MIKIGANSLRLFIFLSLVLSNTPLAMSQTETTGALRGQVHEAGSSKGIGGATVVVTNTENGLSRSVIADDSGNFLLATLPSSAGYSINVTAPGYESQVIAGFAIRVAKVNELDVPLKQGTVNQSVTVQATYEGATLTKAAQVTAGFNTREVAELPSNVAGTGVDTLALLLPGVAVAFGPVNSNGSALSVNGNRPTSNNFNIDGQDNNDQFLAGQVFFVDNLDLIADYQIITGHPAAQFGRNLGANVNIVTKSGANDLHGSGFWFHRDQKVFDSKTNFENRIGQKDPDPLLYNVVGGTVGGPIVKDKVFFFGSYQGVTTRESLTIRSFLTSLPVDEGARLKRDFPNNSAIAALADYSGFALNSLGSVRVDPEFQSPIPFRVGDNTYNAFFTERTFPFSSETPYNQNEFSLRGDIKASSKDGIWTRYLFQDATFKNFLGQFDGFTGPRFAADAASPSPRSKGSNGGGGRGGLLLSLQNSDGFTGDLLNRSHYFGGNWTRQISARASNEFSFSYSTTLNSLGGGCEGFRGCIPSSENIDQTLAFVRLIGPVLGVGPSNLLPFGHTSQVIQFRDTYSLSIGKHQLIAGADIRRQNVTFQGLQDSNGRFFFSTSNFSQNLRQNAASTQFDITVGPDRVNYNEIDQFYFLQDDWKIRENLVINLGLRYEYIGQPFNKLNDITLQREQSAGTSLWDFSVPIADRIVPHIEPDKNNWAPRVGFAYTPRFFPRIFGRDGTVIRGGFSIAYDPPSYIFARDISNSAPTSLSAVGVGLSIGVPDPNPTGARVRSFINANHLIPTNFFDPRDNSRTLPSPNLHSPYAQQWSLGVQRQITRNNLVEVRYLGSHGSGLYQLLDRNPFIDGLANGAEFSLCVGTSFDNCSDQMIKFPGFPNLLPQGVKPDPASGRVTPAFGDLTSIANTGRSTYHSMQSHYSGRFLNQLTFSASYTLSKNLDNVSEVRSFAESSLVSIFQFAPNPFDTNQGERSYSGLDRRHSLAFNGIWDIPFFKEQRGIPGRILGGWQVNSIYLLSSGLRFTPGTFGDCFYGCKNYRPFNGNPNADSRSVAISDVDVALFFTGLLRPSPTGYYSLNQLNRSGFSNFVPVTPNDVRFIYAGPGAVRLLGIPFGDVPRNSLVGPKINTLNAGFFKNTRIGEKFTVQFRTEIYNLFNHPNPGYGFVTSGRGTFENRARPDKLIDDAGLGFNDKTEMEYSRRVIQFGLRVTF